MKSLLFLFFSICILSACTKRNDTLIKGEVKGLHQSEVIFYGFRPDSNESVKIVPIEQEAFTCTLIPDSIWPVLVVLDGKLELPIFAQKGDEILIKGDVNDPSSLIVEGGNSINEELNTWRQKNPVRKTSSKTIPTALLPHGSYSMKHSVKKQWIKPIFRNFWDWLLHVLQKARCFPS